MNFRVPIAVLTLAVVGSAAVAQIDRRDRAEPEITLDHGGRIGFCDMMRWDASGQFLFAAGDDKVVTVWPVNLNAKNGPQLLTDRASYKTLRWASWREKRGGIKNLAIHPTGERVVVGGVGMIPSAVGVLSRTESTAAETVVEGYTWPRARGAVKEDNFGTVTAVAYSANGKRIAFGTSDGSLWVWTPEKLDKPEEATTTDQARTWTAPLRAGKHTTPDEWNKDAQKKEFWNADNLFSRSRLVYFSSENTLVSVSMSGQVVECDLTAKMTDQPGVPAPKVKELFHLNPKGTAIDRVYRAELTPDGKRMSVAFMGPRVQVCGLDGKGAIDFPLDKGLMPYSVAVEPENGRIAIAVGGPKGGTEGDPRFYIERSHEVWVYPEVKAKAEPAVKLQTGRAESVAFHPKRKGLLAVAGGDADEVRLFDLDKKEATVPNTTVRGAGRKIYGIGIGGDALVAVKVSPNADAEHPNDLGGGEWVGYDLSRQRVTLVPKVLITAVNEADGWKVIPDDAKPSDRRRDRWYVVGPNKAKAELSFLHGLYNDPTCYTFLPKTDATPTRLLVGHAHGCSLFELPAGNVPDKLTPTAVYVGHTTEVLSVAASKDGTWFVTGGADHTVAAFSLKAWGAHPTLGATFGLGNQQELVVKAVSVGSPAWEAGLKEGEKVVRVGLAGVRQFNQEEGDGWPKKMGTPAEAVKALAGVHPPGLEVYVETVGKGDARIHKTTLQQRPVWKWFAAFTDAPAAADAKKPEPPRVNDSVVWVWKGSWYHANSPNGDGLVGWHVNAKEVVNSPRFLRLRELSEHYRKPELVIDLLGTRDVAGTITAALGKNPLPQSFTRFEPAPIKLVLRDKQVNGGKVRVKVTVNPIGTNPDLLPEKVEVWVNDFLMEEVPNQSGEAFDKEFTFDAGQLRSGDNVVTVMTHNHLRGRARDAGTVTNTAPPPENPLVVGWVGGVTEYTGVNAKIPPGVRAAFGELNRLPAAVPDAKAISTRFDDYSGKGKFYRENKLMLKTDKEVGPKPLIEELNRLAKPGAVKPDDTLVIFLAGHGVLIGNRTAGKDKGKTVAIPLDDKRPEESFSEVRFAFCGIDFDPEDPTATGVAAETLFKKLVAINCRKLVFLDVCHAGGVMNVDVIRQLMPEGQGPIVFASCDRSELSREDTKGEHGLFTRALLDATGDKFGFADSDSDGELNCNELIGYCTRRVRELRLDMMRKNDPNATRSDQNPVHNLPTVAAPVTAVFKRAEQR